MKKAFSFLFALFLIFSNVTAQNIEPLSAKATFWNLDSFYYYQGSGNQWSLSKTQISINYNQIGKTQDYYIYSYSKVGSWVTDTIHINYFDDLVNVHEFIQYNRDNNSWSDTAIYYRYNDKGQIVYKLYHYVPDYGYKFFYFYDQIDRTDSVIKFSYDDFSDSWEKSYKKKYFYSPSGLVDFIIQFKWTGSWFLDKKTKYHYYHFSFGDKTDTIIKYKYNSQNQGWENYYLYRYIYTSNGQVAEKYVYSWDNDSQQWIRINKTINTYEDTLLTETIVYSYRNDSANSLVSKDKYVYTYNNDNLLISKEYLIYDFNTSEYTPHYKLTFEYNTDGIRTNYTKYSWDNSANDWTYTAKYDYYYRKITYSNLHNSYRTVAIYPNPAVDKIYLQNLPLGSIVKILNMDGSIIYIQKLFNTNTVQVQFLQPGNYILQVHTPQSKSYSFKFIKL